MPCLFCAIARKEIPAEVIYEDTRAVAFLDIHPRALGHTLVIPRTHAATLTELSEDETAPLFEAVRRVTEKISRALRPDGFTIGVNHGSVSGQEVDHLHVHILPRFAGDGGGSVQTLVNKPSKQPIAEVAKTIRIHT